MDVADEEEQYLSPATLGKRINRRRTELGLSISELASRAEISRGMLSEVERGVGNPSYRTLISIARALTTPIGAFFEAEDQEERFGVVRAGDHRKVRMADDIVHELLTPTVNGQLSVYLSRIPVGWQNEEFPDRQPTGEKCVYILEGDYVVYVDDTEYSLHAGDSLTFDASKPHWTRNESGRPVTLFTSVTPPNF